jgi:hypothetical protein
VSQRFVDIDWAAGPVRIEHAWVGASVRGPLLVFLHEGLGSVSMWRDFPQQLCEALGCRGLVYSRPGYGRSTPRAAEEPGTPTSCTARRTRCCRRCWRRWASTGARDAVAVRPQRRRLDRPAARRALPAAPEPVRRAGAAHPGRGPVHHQHREGPQAYETTDLRQRLARHHDDPDSAFWGWNDIWLHAPFRGWNIEAEIGTITCPLLAVQGLDDEYGTLEQIRGIREPGAADAAARAARLRPLAAPDQPEALIAAVGSASLVWISSNFAPRRSPHTTDGDTR